jgi:ATP-dependent DNA helicase Rep
MSDLNPRQRAAIRHIDGPLLVLAGAGSGKTRVITRKIAYLIEECGYAARNVAAVTFTNKAAREMKERVAGLLKGKDTRGLTVCTFHTLGLNMLRREHARLGYKPGFSIFDAQDSAGLLRELLRRDNETAQEGLVEQARARISNWKNALIEPPQALSAAADEQEERIARLYTAYNRHLRAYNAVDFDDLVAQPAMLLRDAADARETWQNRIRYLLVDEYQDTNACQYRLVQLLVGPRGALTVVGDDDQSVYAWRGARPENLQQLQCDFPRLEVIKLEQNYRSATRILKAANQLIANNPHVFEKRLWSELGPGEPMRVLECADTEHEAERVVSELLHHRFRHRTGYGDYAILYRGNHQSRPFERVLREHRIPYRLSGGTSFFAHTEVKDLMAYLRLLANPDDDAAFLRVVNVPRREIGPATLEKLAGYATERGVSLLGAAYELGLGEHLSERALARVRRFCDWLVATGDRARRGDPIAVVRDLVSDLDYPAWLAEGRDARAGERRMQNVEELLAWMQRIAEQATGEVSLAELVAHMTLMDILDRDDDKERGDCVHLLTLHAAKGLEFPHVFIAGMEEELLPHRSSLEEGNVEEERRLAYVGITRAQKSLTFALCTRRKRYGELIGCEPSRFLAELPQDDLVWERAAEGAKPEERQQRGQAHLANLREMLGGG